LLSNFLSKFGERKSRSFGNPWESISWFTDWKIADIFVGVSNNQPNWLQYRNLTSKAHSYCGFQMIYTLYRALLCKLSERYQAMNIFKLGFFVALSRMTKSQYQYEQPRTLSP
jgi:hypothetical protein